MSRPAAQAKGKGGAEMGLPRVILVREERVKDETYLVAGRNVEEAMGSEDGPLTLGTYKLVETRVMRKVPTDVSRPSKVRAGRRQRAR